MNTTDELIVIALFIYPILVLLSLVVRHYLKYIFVLEKLPICIFNIIQIYFIGGTKVKRDWCGDIVYFCKKQGGTREFSKVICEWFFIYWGIFAVTGVLIIVKPVSLLFIAGFILLNYTIRKVTVLSRAFKEHMETLHKEKNKK